MCVVFPLFFWLFSHSVVSPCNLMDVSTPGFPSLHYLPEFAQTHVHFSGVFINRIKFLYIWGLLFVWISFALSVTWHSDQLHGCRKPKSCLKIPLLRNLRTLRRSRPAAPPLQAFPVHVPGPGARDPHHPVSSDRPPPPPMYFFISHLSLSDICFNSTVVPKMLANIQTQSKVITYEGCIIQMYFFLVLGYSDNFLLTVMADDHYVAICHPLHYTVTMSPHLCALLALVSRSLSDLVSLLHSLMVLHLLFSTHMEILDFFCEFAVVLKSACLDALSNYIMLYSVTGLLGIPPLSGILFSYTKIISSILNISLVEGKYKAFCVLWVSPNSHFLIPWDRIRSVSQFCLLPLLLKAGSCLSEVHRGHPYAEPLHLQLEGQGYEWGPEETCQQVFLVLVRRRGCWDGRITVITYINTLAIRNT